MSAESPVFHGFFALDPSAPPSRWPELFGTVRHVCSLVARRWQMKQRPAMLFD
jgi:hypothetical protein